MISHLCFLYYGRIDAQVASAKKPSSTLPWLNASAFQPPEVVPDKNTFKLLAAASNGIENPPPVATVPVGHEATASAKRPGGTFTKLLAASKVVKDTAPAASF